MEAATAVDARPACLRLSSWRRAALSASHWRTSSRGPRRWPAGRRPRGRCARDRNARSAPHRACPSCCAPVRWRRKTLIRRRIYDAHAGAAAAKDTGKIEPVVADRLHADVQGRGLVKPVPGQPGQQMFEAGLRVGNGGEPGTFAHEERRVELSLATVDAEYVHDPTLPKFRLVLRRPCLQSSSPAKLASRIPFSRKASIATSPNRRGRQTAQGRRGITVAVVATAIADAEADLQGETPGPARLDGLAPPL